MKIAGIKIMSRACSCLLSHLGQRYMLHWALCYLHEDEFFLLTRKEACVDFDVLVSMYWVTVTFICRSNIIIIIMIVILIVVTNFFSSLGHEFWTKLHYLSLLQAFVDWSRDGITILKWIVRLHLVSVWPGSCSVMGC